MGSDRRVGRTAQWRLVGMVLLACASLVACSAPVPVGFPAGDGELDDYIYVQFSCNNDPCSAVIFDGELPDLPNPLPPDWTPPPGAVQLGEGDGWEIDTSTPGTRSVVVVASRFPESGLPAIPRTIVASAIYQIGSGAPGVSGVTEDGGTLSTGSTPSPVDPLATSVSTPIGGLVTILEAPTEGTPPQGYVLFAQQVTVTAPDQTVEDPLVLTFSLAASLLDGTEAADVEVFRNSVVVEDCADGVAATSAVPDPCVQQRESLPGGAVRVTVLSSRASVWTFGTQDAPSGPRVSVGDQSGLERDSVTGSVFVPVYLSEPASEPVVVSFYTVDGTATAGLDYARWGTPGNPRTITIPAGAAQGQANVPVLADGEVEADETFSVVLSAVSGAGAVIGRDTGTATIIDADAVSVDDPAITVSSPTVIEGDVGQRRAQFLIHLSRAPVSPVTVTYATVDGTAVAGEDYVAKLPGTVVFAPSQISKTVDVLVNPNTVIDGSRVFALEVAVTGGSPVEEITMSGVATILDDDSTTAEPCAPGTFNSTTGTEPCEPAAPGTFVATAGALAATPCAPGTFQDQAGQTSCQLAPIGSYVNFSGATSATLCPGGTTTLATGSTSPDDCVLE